MAGSHAAQVAREKKMLHRASAIEMLLQAVNENAWLAVHRMLCVVLITRTTYTAILYDWKSLI